MSQEAWDKMSDAEKAEAAATANKAVVPAPALDLEGIKKAVLSVAKALDITIVEGKEDEASPFAKVLDTLQKDSTTFTEILSKLLGRIQDLEKHTAMKKSIEGDDEAIAAADKAHPFDKTVRTLLAKNKVTLR